VTLQPARAVTCHTDITFQGRNIFLEERLTGRDTSKAAQTRSPLAKSYDRNAANIKPKCDFRDLNEKKIKDFM